jgi:hypothetical protein
LETLDGVELAADCLIGIRCNLCAYHCALGRRKEAKRMKLVLMGTLLQNRHDPITPEAVRHLNLIDLVFVREPDVREAWSRYYTVLSDHRLNNEVGFALREDRRNDLLRIMTVSLGYRHQITTSDLLRTYAPSALVDQQEIDMLERRLKLFALRAEMARQQAAGWQPQPTPMAPSTQASAETAYPEEASEG